MFTLDFLTGLGVDLAFETVKVKTRVEVDEFFVPVEDDDDCVLTKLIIPSTCGPG